MSSRGWDQPTIEQIVASLRLAGEPEAAEQVLALLTDGRAASSWRTRALSAEAARDSYAADFAAIRDVFRRGAAAAKSLPGSLWEVPDAPEA